MLHEEHVKHGPLLGGDVDETSMAWRREKRRRKDLPQSSSSDASTATAQGHEAPISYAKDHQGSISDMAIDQAQDSELFGPQVILSEEDQASFVQKLLPDIPPPMSMKQLSYEDYCKLLERHGRFRIAYYKVPTYLPTVPDTTHFI